MVTREGIENPFAITVVSDISARVTLTLGVDILQKGNMLEVTGHPLVIRIQKSEPLTMTLAYPEIACRVSSCTGLGPMEDPGSTVSQGLNNFETSIG
jgi:hypothetical protein